MKPSTFEQAEFIGGPEDGRVFHAEDLTHRKAGGQEISMFLRMDEDLQMSEGDELELVFIGRYAREANGGPQLKYRWIE